MNSTARLYVFTNANINSRAVLHAFTNVNIYSRVGLHTFTNANTINSAVYLFNIFVILRNSY